jgi:uncharacterized RDD family membrane protein YckC
MAEVVTGEAVVLDLSVARFPSRIAAIAIDVAVQAMLLLVLAGVLATAAGRLNLAWLAALGVTGSMLIIVGYPAAFETASRGRTPGKMALGLRVIGDDGSPERFRQALVRALAGLVEIWLLPAIGLITAMINSRGKRLGDIFAGTFVISEQAPARPELPPAFAVIPAPLHAWAATLELSRLPDVTAEAAASYLRRYHDLLPQARDALGTDLAAAVAACVSPPPPPGTWPAAYLAAVLAVRRDFESARLAARSAAGAGPPARPGLPPQ